MNTTILPTTPTPTLLEPSFTDLIAAIEQAAELSEERRRHWICSLRQIAKWLDRPAAVIPYATVPFVASVQILPPEILARSRRTPPSKEVEHLGNIGGFTIEGDHLLIAL